MESKYKQILSLSIIDKLSTNRVGIFLKGLSLSKKSLIYGFFPFLVVLSITFLELGIAFLQSYVFVVLLCIYCNDALNDAHDSH